MTSILERPTAPTTTEVRTVIDCAEYAWNNSPEADVVLACLPDEFVGQYRDALSGVAVAMLEPLLVIEWKRREFKVKFVPRHVIGSSEVERAVPDKTYWSVWDAAISHLPDGTALVEAAGLNDELNGYKEND